MHTIKKIFLNSNLILLVTTLIGVAISQWALSKYFENKRITDIQKRAVYSVEQKIGLKVKTAIALANSIANNPDIIEAVEFLALAGDPTFCDAIIEPIVKDKFFKVVIADLKGKSLFTSDKIERDRLNISVPGSIRSGQKYQDSEVIIRNGFIEFHRMEIIGDNLFPLGILDIIVVIDNDYAGELFKNTGHHFAFMKDGETVVASHPDLLTIEGNPRSHIITGKKHRNHRGKVTFHHYEQNIALFTDVSSITLERYSVFGSTLMVLAAVALVALVVTAILAKKISRPLEHLADKSDDIAGGDYSVRIDGGKSNVLEIEKICASFNTMAAAIETNSADLKKSRFEAEAANRTKSAFLANMSHEIRTPMNAVLGFADMLMETELSENQLEYAGIIKRSGESLLSLINDILDFSKIETGQLDFEEIPFDPELLAYDVCDVIRPRIGIKPIEVLCRIGDSVPARVMGDPTRFRQVLTNMMGNAPKFTEKGEIELAIDVEAERDDRVELHARIRDTGIGIPKDKLDVIFKPFKQADGSTTRKFGGTGLGLAICRKIARLTDGKVWVESEVGQGSVFHFTGWFGKIEEKAGERVRSLPLSGKKALIVDDNRTNLDILEYMLKRYDIEIGCLSGGKQVVPALRRAFESGNPFDICLLDIQMPDVSGYETAEAIRSSDREIRNTPLLALSSLMERDAKKCQDAGFDGFLSKPVRREKLYCMMEKLLGKRGEEENKAERTQTQIATQYSVKEEMKRSVRILLVEDNQVNQKLAGLMLTKAGYQLEIADDGQAAVNKYTRSADDFDLIFMDVQMPNMDGLEATRTIRELEKNDGNGKQRKPIPIIAMTAGAMKGDREACLEAGMDDYVSKPIKREIVYKMVEKWILAT